VEKGGVGMVKGRGERKVEFMNNTISGHFKEIMETKERA
jgi:hypothetical protein